MNLETRVSIVDGKIEKICYKVVNLSELPNPNPFVDAVSKTENRLSLIDGTIEEVELVVLLPIRGRRKINE